MAKKSRLPKSIVEAEAAIAAQDAAEKEAEAAALTAQQEPAASENPTETPPAQTVEQPQSPTGEEALQKQIADMTAQMTVLREEHKLAQEQSAYYKQRWDSLAGIHKKQVTDVQQQNRELTARVSELEATLKSVPQADEDLAAVKKDLGDKAGEYSDDYLAQMARNRRLAREAAESRFGKEISELRKKVAAIDSTGKQSQSLGFWEKVEQLRPGFKAAREDFNSGYELWFGDNANESDKMNRQQRMDTYADMGDVDKVVGMLDEFSRVSGYKFGQSAETQVTPPPQMTKPTSVQTPAQAASQSAQGKQTDAPKPRFPQAFAHDLTMKWARLSAGAFKPFTISAGGKTVTFTNRSQVAKMAMECEDALVNDRVY